ncbi:MAG: hypothetical protein ABIE43_03280 [Patescibacteria group bacterium]
MNFIPQEVKVVLCQEINPGSDYFLIRLHWPNHQEIQPGQFFTIHTVCDESTAARPFCFFDWNKNTVDAFIGKVGRNTELYSNLQLDDKIMISGPKGNPVPIDDNCQNYILVAGGRGVAGIYPIAKKLRQMGKKVIVKLGAEKLAQIVCVDMFTDLGCTVESIVEHDQEKTGFVTELLEEELRSDQGKSIIIACGPVPMYDEINNLISASGNTGYALMEQVMTCGGTGASKCCAVSKTDETIEYVCQDGPAFKFSEVNWEIMMRPHIIIPLESSPKKVNPLEVSLGGIVTLYSPIITASGTSDHKSIASGQFDPTNIGGLEVKGIMLKKRDGNPPPRTSEIENGDINTIGLAGVGIERFVDEDLSEWKKFGVPIFVNIAGETIGDFGQVASYLKGTGIAVITANISCPNVSYGGIVFGIDPHSTSEVITAIRREADTSTLVSVKFTPMAGTATFTIIDAAVSAGADIICIGNTFMAMDYNLKTRRPTVSRNWGGQSGPGNFHQILYFVRQAYLRHPKIPIIMVGGINSGERAIKAHLAGATAIQVGTATFNDYEVISKIHSFYPKILTRWGVNNVTDIIGQGNDFTSEEFEQ